MVSERGPVKMVVEYQTPNRMHQILTPLTEDKPVEAIVIGDKAWTNNGEGWKRAPAGETEQLVQFMIKSIAQVYQEVGKFECVGTESRRGPRASRLSRPEEPTEARAEPAPQERSGAHGLLDPATGLPARSILPV